MVNKTSVFIIFKHFALKRFIFSKFYGLIHIFALMQKIRGKKVSNTPQKRFQLYNVNFKLGEVFTIKKFTFKTDLFCLDTNRPSAPFFTQKRGYDYVINYHQKFVRCFIKFTAYNIN